jgi:cholinesterase
VPFANYLPYNPNGYNLELAQLAYLSLFLCPQTQTARLRQRIGLTTYVYRYAGNFSNISPKPWMGAYHSSELPLLMGTHPNFRGPSSRLEYATSYAMQDAWVAFAKDPQNGLTEQDWKPYPQLGMAVVREFGAGQPAGDVSIAKVEALCAGNAPAI